MQVLRLMENFQPEEVHDAVRDAIRLGAVSFDAVKHLVLCRIEGRPPRLDMELYPYLPKANVATTSTQGLHDPPGGEPVMTNKSIDVARTQPQATQAPPRS